LGELFKVTFLRSFLKALPEIACRTLLRKEKRIAKLGIRASQLVEFVHHGGSIGCYDFIRSSRDMPHGHFTHNATRLRHSL